MSLPIDDGYYFDEVHRLLLFKCSLSCAFVFRLCFVFCFLYIYLFLLIMLLLLCSQCTCRLHHFLAGNVLSVTLAQTVPQNCVETAMQPIAQ